MVTSPVTTVFGIRVSGGGRGGQFFWYSQLRLQGPQEASKENIHNSKKYPKNTFLKSGRGEKSPPPPPTSTTPTTVDAYGWMSLLSLASLTTKSKYCTVAIRITDKWMPYGI